MGKSIYDPRHKATAELLKEKREAAGLRQSDLGARVGRSQYWISDVELGRRRIDIIEFMDLFSALGLTPWRIMKAIDERPPPERSEQKPAVDQRKPRNRARKTRRKKS